MVALSKNRYRGVAKIIAEIAGKKPDQEFAKNRGLLEPPHDEAAEGSAQRDEDRGDKDGDDGVGVREPAATKDPGYETLEQRIEVQTGGWRHPELLEIDGVALAGAGGACIVAGT